MNRLPEEPTIEDLKKFSKIRLKKRRSIKKFHKDWRRYVSTSIGDEYLAKRLCMPIKRSLGYAELGEKLIMVDSL